MFIRAIIVQTAFIIEGITPTTELTMSAKTKSQDRLWRQAEVNAKKRINILVSQYRKPLEKELEDYDLVLNGIKRLEIFSKKDRDRITASRDKLKKKLTRIHPDNISPHDWQRIVVEEYKKLAPPPTE